MAKEENPFAMYQTTNSVAKSLQTIQHTELTPQHIKDFKLDKCSSLKNIHVMAKTALNKDGLEGADAGAGAAVLGVVAVATAVSAPVTVPVLVAAGIIGGILGFIRKKNDPWKY